MTKGTQPVADISSEYVLVLRRADICVSAEITACGQPLQDRAVSASFEPSQPVHEEYGAPWGTGVNVRSETASIEDMSGRSLAGEHSTNLNVHRYRTANPAQDSSCEHMAVRHAESRRGS